MPATENLFEKHQQTLETACQAIYRREHWTPYPEVPSGRIYGETAAVEGKADFDRLTDGLFSLEMAATDELVGEEVSPWGLALNIRYRRPDVGAMVAAAGAAMASWRDAGAEVRTGICLEILARLNRRSFEMAHAVQHTTGQGFAMAFQAGGPHAQDRGLEAVACSWQAMQQVTGSARWSKPQGKRNPLVMDKRYHIVPRGVALVIACSTFPTWNTYSGLFASLVTGNPVIIKPHPQAVLPLAITVQVAQQVLKEQGFDPKLVMLAADSSEQPVTAELAASPAVRIIDYTGSNGYADWLQDNARQARLYTEKAGVNTVVIDSVRNLKAVCQNLAFSLSLYSGQMCTTPQVLLIPKQGIDTDQGRLSFDEVAATLTEAVTELLSDPERASGILGCIPSAATRQRLVAASKLGRVVLASEQGSHPQYPAASYHTPLLLAVDAGDDCWRGECFGPVSFLVATDSTEQSLQLASSVIEDKGSITFAAYSTDESVLERAELVAVEQGVALSCNLDGGVFVNQSAAFSDFHATGNNPAASASLTDLAFVADRFAVVQSRRPAPSPEQ